MLIRFRRLLDLFGGRLIWRLNWRNVLVITNILWDSLVILIRHSFISRWVTIIIPVAILIWSYYCCYCWWWCVSLMILKILNKIISIYITLSYHFHTLSSLEYFSLLLHIHALSSEKNSSILLTIYQGFMRNIRLIFFKTFPSVLEVALEKELTLLWILLIANGSLSTQSIIKYY